MSRPTATITIPAGTWELDPAHSSINFSARHLMVSRVRGRFGSFSATVTIAEDLLASSVTASMDAGSMDTRDENRDTHLKSPDFLDVDKWPALTFASTGVRDNGDGTYEVDGDLTIRDVTRPLGLQVTFHGLQNDPWGGTRIGFDATTDFRRKDFGLEWNVALEGGGVLVGDKVTVELEVEALKK
jgi:polyisoprenoid-binding protein YceI